MCSSGVQSLACPVNFSLSDFAIISQTLAGLKSKRALDWSTRLALRESRFGCRTAQRKTHVSRR